MKKRGLILLLLLLLFLGIFLFFSGFLNGQYSEKNNQFKTPVYTFSSGEEVVDDNANNLMWQKNCSIDRLDWDEAIEYCNAFTLEGFDDWRLPNKEELDLLFDYSKDNFFWTSECDIHGYWSNTTSLDNPTFAEGFRFEKHDSSRSKSDAWYFVARCIRSE